MRPLLFFLFLTLSSLSFAQKTIKMSVGHLAEDNRKFKVTDLIVRNLRKVAQTNLLENGDKKQLQHLLDSIVLSPTNMGSSGLGSSKRPYLTFKVHERIMFDFYLENYDLLLEGVKSDFHFHLTEKHIKSYYDNNYYIDPDIDNSSIFNSLLILDKIENTLKGSKSLRSEDSDFLEIYWLSIKRTQIFDHLINEFSISIQESIDQKAAIFLSKYPKSAYKEFIELWAKDIVEKERSFGFGVEFSQGYSQFVRETEKTFFGGNHGGINFDLTINKFIYSIRINGSGGSIDDEELADSNISSADKWNTLYFGFNVGRTLLKTKRFSFSPYTGIVFGAIGISSEYIKKKTYVLKDNYSPSVDIGFTTDFKFKYDNRKVSFVNAKNAFAYIRLRLGYMASPIQNQFNLSSNLMYVNMAIGYSGFSNWNILKQKK